jgi:hypothetical protein
MADNVERDDWGFTDAEHEELRALTEKHGERGRDVLIGLMLQGGVAATPDDLGHPAIGTMVVGDDGHARGFPPGGLWRALLEGLRALDGEKGGA